MSSEIERDVWKVHDSRLNAHEKEHAEFSRSFQEITDQIKYMIGRIDNGLSPSVNDVRKENSEIKLAITNLDHKFEINQMKMKEEVDTGFELVKKDIDKIVEWKDKFQNIWVWSIVSGFVIAVVAFGSNRIIEKAFKKQTDDVPNIKAIALKK